MAGRRCLSGHHRQTRSFLRTDFVRVATTDPHISSRRKMIGSASNGLGTWTWSTRASTCGKDDWEEPIRVKRGDGTHPISPLAVGGTLVRSATRGLVCFSRSPMTCSATWLSMTASSFDCRAVGFGAITFFPSLLTFSRYVDLPSCLSEMADSLRMCSRQISFRATSETSLSTQSISRPRYALLGGPASRWIEEKSGSRQLPTKLTASPRVGRYVS